MSHQFTEEQVRATVHALDGAGVEVIECSHGDGIGGSSFNYGFSRTDEMTLIRAAAEEATQAKIAILLVPGIGTMDDLRNAARGRRVGRAHRDALHRGGRVGAALRPGPLARHGDRRVLDDEPPHQPGRARAAGAVHGRRRRRVRLRRRLGRRAGDGRGEASASKPCTPRSAPRRRSASTATRTSRSASPTPSSRSRPARGRSTDRCARSARAPATPPPRCSRRRSTTSASRPASTSVACSMPPRRSCGPYLPRWPKADRTAIVQGWAGVYSSFLLHAEHAAERYGVAGARDPAARGRGGLRRRPGGHAHRHRAAAGPGTRPGGDRRTLIGHPGAMTDAEPPTGPLGKMWKRAKEGAPRQKAIATTIHAVRRTQAALGGEGARGADRRGCQARRRRPVRQGTRDDDRRRHDDACARRPAAR